MAQKVLGVKHKVKQLPLIILKVGSLELIVIVEMARIIK